MEEGSEKKFPLNAKDYKLYEEVGEGVSATVYRALCIPLNEIIAVKVLDLEKCNNDLVCRIFHTCILALLILVSVQQVKVRLFYEYLFLFPTYMTLLLNFYMKCHCFWTYIYIFICNTSDC